MTSMLPALISKLIPPLSYMIPLLIVMGSLEKRSHYPARAIGSVVLFSIIFRGLLGLQPPLSAAWDSPASLLMLLLIVFQCHSSLFRVVKPAGPRQPTVSSFHHHDGRRLALRLRTAPSLMDMPVHAHAPRLAQRRQPWCKPLHQVVSMQYSAHHGAPRMASMPWKTGLQPRCSSPTM